MDAPYMIEFALRWYRWGGGPSDEIFIEFGVRPHTYFRRLLVVLETADLDPFVKIDMRAVCLHRLGAGPGAWGSRLANLEARTAS